MQNLTTWDLVRRGAVSLTGPCLEEAKRRQLSWGLGSSDHKLTLLLGGKLDAALGTSSSALAQENQMPTQRIVP